jgi:hypothetical protein
MDGYVNELLSLVCDGNIADIKEREKELWQVFLKLEAPIIPRNTQKEIKKILGKMENTDC